MIQDVLIDRLDGTISQTFRIRRALLEDRNEGNRTLEPWSRL